MTKDNCLQPVNQSPIALDDDIRVLNRHQNHAGLDIAVTGEQNRYALQN